MNDGAHEENSKAGPIQRCDDVLVSKASQLCVPLKHARCTPLVVNGEPAVVKIIILLEKTKLNL